MMIWVTPLFDAKDPFGGQCKHAGRVMHRHKGFPSRLTGTDFQFTIRRENKKGPTPLIERERYADRRPADRRADEGFMAALWEYFGETPFERGNLDAGRLSWLLGREVVATETPFDPESYETELKIDVRRASASFPHIIHGNDDGDLL